MGLISRVSSRTYRPDFIMVATPDMSEKPEKSAKTLLAEGKRDFICKDYNSASENFSRSVEKLTIEFGDQAEETAEGYYWYGKALLECSRNQQDFLGTKAENEDVENQDPTESMEKVKLDAVEEEEPEEEEEGEAEEEEEDDVTDAQLAYEMFELS